tara:strand:+ start:681 stop:908 length:228 start_codon:yes stop_codon:yes gene_type:complete
MNCEKSLTRQLPVLYRINSGTIHKRCYALRCEDIKLDKNFENFLNNIKHNNNNNNHNNNINNINNNNNNIKVKNS